MFPGRRRTQRAACVALLLLVGCRGTQGEQTQDKPTGDEPMQGEPKELTILAAASLTETFADLEHAYEEAHPEVDVMVSVAGSQVLRLQIEQGARADLFASADERHVDALKAVRLLDESEVFAHNQLVVVVPEDDPAGIQRFQDLPKAQRLVVGTEEAPIGRYTRQLFERADRAYGSGFSESLHIVSQESNVRLVRTKVLLGEADAAIVYRTDRVAGLREIALPPELSVGASYAIGRLERSPHPEVARDLMSFLRTEPGRRILIARGLEPAERR